MNRDDLYNYFLIRTSLNSHGKMPSSLEPQQLEAMEKQARNQYALVERALATGRVVAHDDLDGEVEQAIKAMADCFSDEATFETALLSNGLSLDSLKEIISDELDVGRTLEEVAGEAACAVTDAEVDEFYQLYRDRFINPERRRAKHILITINDEFPENERNKSLARCEELVTELKGEPGKFSELAKQHSECPTAMEDGLLGEIPAGTLYPELEEVLFQMEEGEVSEVVESPIGFHILLCEKIHAQRPMAFDEVKGSIRKRLEQRKRKQALAEWFGQKSEQRAYA